MSYLRKTKATCGRRIQKPNEADESLNYEDETLPLQDQIDNLRAKIYLKEKYNKALREEVSETNEGAATMISELIQQNKQLREDLDYEKHAEVHTVKKALRSYRLFQLAVTGKDAESVVCWLDDKIFDASKTLNEGIYLLSRMQNKIHEAEGQVRFLESCPVPGTEPWELAAEENRQMLESNIENTKANRDAASILNKKYTEILYMLRGERGKWPHIMETMEKSLSQLRHELASLEVMLEDAKRFRDEACEKLKLTEEEASANRKQRRSQMNRMKRSVQKALDDNIKKYKAPPQNARPGESPSNRIVHRGISSATGHLNHSDSKKVAAVLQELKIKQHQVQEYENRANKIVEAMRVRDLNGCPGRLITVRRVNEVLTSELELKQKVREVFLNHKYRLELLLQYFKYTGCQRDEEFADHIREREEHLQIADEEVQVKRAQTNAIGKIAVDLRYSMLGMQEMFVQGKKNKSSVPSKTEEIRVIMKRIVDKVGHLVKAVETLQGAFSDDSKPQRSYVPYVSYQIPNRFVRVGAAEEVELDDDSDQEEGAETTESKIPSREELKMRSEKYRAQVMLRRGIR